MGLLKILFCINLFFFQFGEAIRISFWYYETKLLDVSVLFFSLCWFSYGIVNKKINKTIYFPALGFIFMGFLSLACKYLGDLDRIRSSSLLFIYFDG